MVAVDVDIGQDVLSFRQGEAAPVDDFESPVPGGGKGFVNFVII